MIIEEIMQRDIHTLKPTDSIEKACELILKNKIRHIPIVNDDQQIVGLISDRDIRDVSPSIFHTEEHWDDLQKPVATIMIEDVITGHPLDFVEEISAVFYENKIGSVPIVSDNKLVGLVTETDMLHTMVQMMGVAQPSSRIEVKVENKAGVLAEVSAVFKKCKANIISVLVFPNQVENHKVVVFRIQTINPMGVITELRNEGYEVLWPNLPGVSL